MDRNEYFIHSEIGRVKSFCAESDEQAEDIFHSDKSLPANTQLDLNRFDVENNRWYHVTSLMRISNK
jgi:hypothetical protein